MFARIVTLLGRLPLELRRVLGRVIGTIFSFIPTRDRRIARLQLRLVFGDSPPPLWKVYSHVGQVALESINIEPLVHRIGRDVEASEIDRMLARYSGRAAITLSAHTGNWELLAATAIARGVPLTLIAREAKRPEWQGVLRSIRERYGGSVIWRADRDGTVQVLKALTERRTIAALLDQDTEVRSILVPFFSIPVQVPSSLIEVAKRLKIPVVSAFCFRDERGGYRIEVTEFDLEQSVEAILLEYHRRLESLIRAHPEQWVWFHKRWRTLQDGKRLSSREYVEYLEGIVREREANGAARQDGIQGD